MDKQKYLDFLLSSIPSASKASGGKVVNCRCFECPDSSNPSSKHFYISIPQSPEEPSLYYCHLCKCSGVVTHKKLIEWGIYDNQIAVELAEHNKKCSKVSGNSKYYDRTVYNVINNFISEDFISQVKLNYINSRIGQNFSYDDLKKLKIVLNLKDILKANHITKLTRYQNIVDQLDDNFLGFLSIDNAFLNMRRICDGGLVDKSIDKRYINYKLFDKFDTSERFYTVPTEIDLSRIDKVKIHIAEGPFDILSIYTNLRNMEPGIYTSIGGSNYLGIALYFLEVFKLPYVEFHYYPDNDKYGSNDAMRRVNYVLQSLGFSMYIHRNTMNNEKDFGVSTNKIKESIYRL